MALGQPRGISIQLNGSSTLGVGCLCKPEDQMWSQMDDGFQTSACSRCNRVWHTCPVHLVPVGGEPVTRDYDRPTPPCTCRKTWLPPRSNCPHCGAEKFLQPYDTTSTKICQNCRKSYHTCPLHGKSVDGPGYPLSSREQTFCQCHQNPAFLGTVWSKPFQ